MLESKRIKLRLLEPDDMKQIVEWRNTEQSYNSFLSFVPLNLDRQMKWYNSQVYDFTQSNFAVIHKDTGLMIGMIGIYDIDNASRKCEWGRILIGHPEFLNQGYGREAIEVVLEYAFDYLNMNRVQCTCIGSNRKVITLYKSIGFTEEGTFRDYVFKNNKYDNVVLFSILKKEYKEKRKHSSS